MPNSHLTPPEAATFLPLTSDPPISGRTELRARDSFLYRIRIPATAVCLAIGVGLTVWHACETTGHVTNSLCTVIGFGFVLSGVLVRLWALSTIGGRKSRELVTTGLYSLTRNPLYVGTFLSVVGGLLIWQSPLLSMMLVPPVLIYLHGVVPWEEQLLRKKFGAEFDTYCQRTNRWLPSISQFVPADQFDIRSRAFVKEVQCGFWWMALAGLSAWAQIIWLRMF